MFCATQQHALAVRDLINQYKSNPDTHYCERVTANDGKEGERWLRVFQDSEKTIPTILTTSQKLSTGVDARNVRNIDVNASGQFQQRGDGSNPVQDIELIMAYDGQEFNFKGW